MRVTSTTCVTDGDPRRLGRAHCASSGSAGREGVDAAGTTGHRPAGDEHRERRRSSGRDAHSGAPGGGAPPRLSADTPSQRSGRLAGSRAHAQPPAIPRGNWSWRLCGCRHSGDRRLRAGDNQCPTFPDVSGPAAALHALILNPAHCRGRHRNHSGADHVRPGGSSTPHSSSTSNYLMPANSPSSWPSARSRWPSLPLGPTPPAMPMSGLVDRTGCHEQKRPSIPSRSTERTRAYGRIYAPEVADGRKARGIRASDQWALPGSNRRPAGCKPAALPTELNARAGWVKDPVQGSAPPDHHRLTVRSPARSGATRAARTSSRPPAPGGRRGPT